MSLLVWLPLKGNLRQQGLSNLTFTNNNTTNITTTAAGKIGRCYQRATKQTAGRISSDKTVNLNEDITMCCWAMVTDAVTSTGYAHGILTNHSHANNTGLGITAKVISDTDYRISCSTGNGSARTWDTYYGTTNIKNTWHHLALTYSKSDKQLLLYVDGNIEYTLNNYNNASRDDYIMLFEWSTTYDNSAHRCAVKLNDVRIYDECLSQKQIKEIAKGLVAHFKLDARRPINNLRRNSTPGVYNNYSSSGTTGSLTLLNETYDGGKIWRLTMTPNATSISNFRTALYSHGITTSGMKYLANTKYCFWILYRPVTHKDVRVGGTASNIQGWHEITPKKWNNEWYVVGQYRNGTVTVDKTDSIFTSFYTPTAEEGVPISIDFCCPHLVEGYDYILPEYDYMGTSLGYIMDTSGYGYALTGIDTSMTNTLDTPRYSCALTRDTATKPVGRISSGLFLINQTINELTLCGWWKTTAANTNTKNLISLNGNSFIRFGPSSATTLWIYCYFADNNTRYLEATIPYSITDNNWHFYATTFKDGVIKAYVDGNLIGTKDCSADSTQLLCKGTTNYLGGYNASQELVPGSFSDYRIYVTALSADDIKQLYTTCTFIDDKNNLLTCEFSEV